MPKNIAIVTMTEGFNLGNSLQNYALQKVLKELHFNPYTLISSDNYFHTNKSILTLFKKNTFKRIIGFLINYNNFRNYIFEISKKKLIYKNFDKYIQFKQIKNSDLALISSEFDFFIAGSDQIWNPEYRVSNFDFLTFAPYHKRVAYAASFGIKNIPEHLKLKYKNWLEGIKHISVREEAGVDIIQELTDRKPELLVDPTLLLNKQEWINIMQKPSFQIPNKYILVYFLGKKDNYINECIKKLSESRKIDIVDIFDKNNDYVYRIGPAEFIYLIANAEFVFTDSFHGTIFSIIFTKQFIVAQRNEKIDMSSRLNTLLQRFALSSRYIKDLNDYNNIINTKVNFENSRYILKKEYQKSEIYLKNALNIK